MALELELLLYDEFAAEFLFTLLLLLVVLYFDVVLFFDSTELLLVLLPLVAFLELLLEA